MFIIHPAFQLYELLIPKLFYTSKLSQPRTHWRGSEVCPSSKFSLCMMSDGINSYQYASPCFITICMIKRQSTPYSILSPCLNFISKTTFACIQSSRATSAYYCIWFLLSAYSTIRIRLLALAEHSVTLLSFSPLVLIPHHQSLCYWRSITFIAPLGCITYLFRSPHIVISIIESNSLDDYLRKGRNMTVFFWLFCVPSPKGEQTMIIFFDRNNPKTGISSYIINVRANEHEWRLFCDREKVTIGKCFGLMAKNDPSLVLPMNGWASGAAAFL